MTEALSAKPIIGYRVSKMVYVAAKLELADKLRSGSRTAAELAADANVDPERLGRLLRALASVGVFADDGEGRYERLERTIATQ